MFKASRISTFGVFAIFAASWAMLAGCHSSTTPPSVVAASQYLVTPVAANRASYGVAATNVDTNLEDSWGLAFNNKFGYPWVANRASGTTSIFDASGKAINHYFVKGPGGTMGSPTGVVQDTTGSFPVAATGASATWLFSELDGTIAAVSSGSAQKDSAFILTDRSANSSFTGLALGSGAGGPWLYAPNVRNGSLDQFDASYNRVQFSGKYSGLGYTPFNTIVIDTQMFVTHAKMATVGGQPFVALGPGNGGYVDIYHLDGSFEGNLIPNTTNDSLDEPWGVAIAPASFGTYSGDLLVGNFGDGRIHAYNRSTGALVGTLNDATGAPIAIPGLWALVVYDGTLYYTAGPNAGADGVFGTITVK